MSQSDTDKAVGATDAWVVSTLVVCSQRPAAPL